MNKKDKVIRIVLSVLFVAAVAVLGSYFTDTDSEWYQSLVKPALQPPAVVFPIVWTVLYVLIAVSLSLAAIDKNTTNKTLWLYLINGVLNVVWSYTFFYQQNPGGAFFVLILLIITAVLLFANVYRDSHPTDVNVGVNPISKTAAYLLLPYIVWLFFALYLNYELAFYN